MYKQRPTHTHTHTLLDAEWGGDQDAKDRKHPGGTGTREEEGQREHLSLLWLPVVASKEEVNPELEKQEVLIVLGESFKVQ